MQFSGSSSSRLVGFGYNKLAALNRKPVRHLVFNLVALLRQMPTLLAQRLGLTSYFGNFVGERLLKASARFL
ncbi:hypothetical protein ACFFWD_15805 [Bradyrhizobium erythrophlei]|uniref:hypothetical protein n=1 Tax=Bradyrhizobium erythrophlei TaxID=1437360 RepID=UPI0035EE18E8